MANILVQDKYLASDGSISIEAFIGPHATLEAALAAIPVPYRSVGREVAIKTGNSVSKYKLDGFDDSDATIRTNLTTSAFVPIGGTSNNSSGGNEIIVDPVGIPVDNDTNNFLLTNYPDKLVGTEVYDTVNRFMYKKIFKDPNISVNDIWAKTAAVHPDTSVDPAGVIQGINLIAHK